MKVLRALAVSLALGVGLSWCSPSQKSENRSQTTASTAATAAPTPTPTEAPDLSARTRDTPEPRYTHKAASELNVADMNESVLHLMNAYIGLRSRVSDIIDQIANGTSSAKVVGNVGQQWYSDERNFQSEVRGLPTSLKTNSQYMLIAMNLDEVETFLYSAGADAMMSCAPHTARQDLEAADYFFHAVEKETKTGQSSPEDAANPPQVDSTEHTCGS